MNKKNIFIGTIATIAIAGALYLGAGIHVQAATTKTVDSGQPSAEVVAKIKTITSLLKSIKVPTTVGDKPKIHYTDNGWCIITNHGQVIGAYQC